MLFEILSEDAHVCSCDKRKDSETTKKDESVCVCVSERDFLCFIEWLSTEQCLRNEMHF